jgi:hypothetical protein
MLRRSRSTHVVAPSAYADGYAIAGECAGEGLASELRALVGVVP